MQPARTVHIKQKLAEIGVSVDDISLGSWDDIGEICCKQRRDPNSELYKKVGSVFKPNMEKALLINALITKHNLSSYLEIGFGRGFSALAAARSFQELGNDGMVMSIEPNVDDKFMNIFGQVFPSEWTNRIQLARARSQDVLPKVNESFDLVFVDGDHTKAAVQADWEGVKDRFNCFCLFDDWMMDVGTDPMIQVHEALDGYELPSDVTAELIVMDRRIFPDERGWPDEKIRYGQLLLTKQSGVDAKSKATAYKTTWEW